MDIVIKVKPTEDNSDIITDSYGKYGCIPYQLRFRVPLEMADNQAELTEVALDRCREDMAKKCLSERKLFEVYIFGWTYVADAHLRPDTYGAVPADHVEYLYVGVKASRPIYPDTDRELCDDPAMECICAYEEMCAPGGLIEFPMRVETYARCPQHGTYRSKH